MTTPLFLVEQPGLFTTVQDRGRFGCQRDGVSPAGAMDPWAAQVGNILVGNGRDAAVLEVTLRGPTLAALGDVWVAVCGADLSAHVEGHALPLWRTAHVRRGQILGFGARRSGARAYLAVAGGLDVPPVLGSRSTLTRAGLGGVAGRALRAGDVLHGGQTTWTGAGRALAPSEAPDYASPGTVRVVPGPHGEWFEADTLAGFFRGGYEVTPRADRMGYCLSGPRVGYVVGPNASLLSEAAPRGGVQVPPDGRPVVLMADRQTIGGYPLLGVVASADWPVLAQLAPGDEVEFEAVTRAEAEAGAVAQERRLRLLARAAALLL